MAIFKLVLTLMFLLRKGISGCSLVDLDVPVVPFCQNHQRSGRTIVIESDSVPQNQIVTCICDVRVAGTQKLITTYESPDYLNCGVELQLDDKVYSCADSEKYINVDETFSIMYRKTITRENPSMCIMFHSEPESSEIKVYCKTSEEQPATVKTTRKETNARTTKQETNTTLTTASRTESSKPSHETISSIIYWTLVSNTTSLQQTSPSLSANTARTRTSVATTFPPSFSAPIANRTSKASVASSVTSKLPVNTTQKSSFQTTDQWMDSSVSFLASETTIKPNISLNSTSPAKFSTSEPLKTEQFPSYSNQPTTVLLTKRTLKPEDHATSENRRNTSESLEPTQRRYSTSEGHGSTSKNPPASMTEVMNATFTNSGKTIENSQWKKVVIICSATGSVLLLIIAVALSILVYRYRMIRTKKTLKSSSQQSYIDAFDQEDGSGKRDGASLNSLVPNENINEPSKELYSIPREFHRNKPKQNHQRFNDDNKQSFEAKGLEVSHRNNDGLIQGSITSNPFRASKMDNEYDHFDNRKIDTMQRSSVEGWSDYDHVNAHLKDNVEEEPPDLSGWIGNDESGILSTTVSPNPQIEWPAHYSYKKDGLLNSPASLTESQAGSELYAIVRKPKDMYLQKKRTKLVSFKGYEDDEEENNHKPKGILKHKSTEAHPVEESYVQDNQETIYDSTHIPRVKLDKYLPITTVNQHYYSYNYGLINQEVILPPRMTSFFTRLAESLTDKVSLCAGILFPWTASLLRGILSEQVCTYLPLPIGAVLLFAANSLSALGSR